MYGIVAVVTGADLVWVLESALLWVFRLTKSVLQLQLQLELQHGLR